MNITYLSKGRNVDHFDVLGINELFLTRKTLFKELFVSMRDKVRNYLLSIENKVASISAGRLTFSGRCHILSSSSHAHRE